MGQSWSCERGDELKLRDKRRVKAKRKGRVQQHLLRNVCGYCTHRAVQSALFSRKPRRPTHEPRDFRKCRRRKASLKLSSLCRSTKLSGGNREAFACPDGTCLGHGESPDEKGRILGAEGVSIKEVEVWLSEALLGSTGGVRTGTTS